MNKLYSMLAATAVVFSASAAPALNQLGEKSFINADPASKTKTETRFQNTEQFNATNVEEITGGTRVLTGMRKADDQKSIEGIWTFYFGNYYQQGGGNVVAWDYIATVQSGKIHFDDPEGIELPLICSLEDDGQTITLTRELLGMIELYYVYQEPFVYNPKLSTLLDYQDIHGTYNAEAGLIKFDNDLGIAWNGYADYSGSQYVGIFGIYDILKAEQISKEPNEGLNEAQEGFWEPFGMATFIDGFIIPGYRDDDGKMMNPNEFPFEVELQRNVENPLLWRLWKPYHADGYILLENNESTYQGQIQLDLTYSDAVQVIANNLPAGFKDNNGEYYMTNELGWWVNYWNGLLSASEVQSVLDSQGKVRDTYDVETGVVTINVPEFDFEAAHENGYTWRNLYPAYITFPKEAIDAIAGVETVITDQVQTAPRYFNMQGIEVKEPVKGGIYILVNGKKSSKIVY